jgi:ribosomal protein L30E
MVVNIQLRLKKELKTKGVILGTKKTIKNILKKENKVEKIYVSSDCPEDIKNNLEKIKGVDTELIYLDFTKEDLKDICKKPFNISVISVLSGKETKLAKKKEKTTKTKIKKETKPTKKVKKEKKEQKEKKAKEEKKEKKKQTKKKQKKKKEK